ncbi:MAG: winged helix-turn-helix domain-containing protein [Gammaproteobacteria bacterium]|nr:winged helix-turn-helix domain-containing protein [Gammaproteobacteria bacterium]
MRYFFNDFVLDTELFELRQYGKHLAAEPQVIELLALLIENNDRVVTKEEINEKIWHGRIVSDAAVSSRIKSARQILGDDGKSQRIILTIHKKGFRFVADIRPDPENNDPKNITNSILVDSNDESVAIESGQLENPAVAVLPFHNMAAQPDQEYLADGITTDIITHLSRHRWLKVTARNTSFGYKGKSVNIQDVGRALEVDYVLEGSVQRASDRVRITAQLIDAHSGHNTWGEHFDREISDIFSLQDEITEKIVARVEPEIGIAERNRVINTRPANLKAWDCYHLGVYHFFRFTGDDNLEAQRLLSQSIELDSRFGEAHAWWAYAVIIGMVYWDTEPTQALLDSAFEASNNALLLDNQNATFHALKARTLLARCEYAEAITENEIAISLNPTFAAAHCGLGDSLAYEGNYDDAIVQFTRAISLSPNDPQRWAFFSYGALALIFQGNYEEALAWSDRASAIPNCQYWATAHKIVALAYLNKSGQLKKALRQLKQEKADFSIAFARQKLFYIKDPIQLNTYLEGLELAGF